MSGISKSRQKILQEAYQAYKRYGVWEASLKLGCHRSTVWERYRLAVSLLGLPPVRVKRSFHSIPDSDLHNVYDLYQIHRSFEKVAQLLLISRETARHRYYKALERLSLPAVQKPDNSEYLQLVVSLVSQVGVTIASELLKKPKSTVHSQYDKAIRHGIVPANFAKRESHESSGKKDNRRKKDSFSF